jgi:hypothetical protein
MKAGRRLLDAVCLTDRMLWSGEGKLRASPPAADRSRLQQRVGAERVPLDGFSENRRSSSRNRIVAESCLRG